MYYRHNFAVSVIRILLMILKYTCTYVCGDVNLCARNTHESQEHCSPTNKYYFTVINSNISTHVIMMNKCNLIKLLFIYNLCHLLTAQ